MWKKLIVCALVSLVLTGCAGGGNTPPLIKLETGAGAVDGFQSSYCWDRRVGPGICVDSIEPRFDSAIPLPAGEPIRLQLERPLPSDLTLSLSTEVFGDAVVTERVAPAAVVDWPVSVVPGTYILAASGTWPQGDVTYWFSIAFE